MENEEREYGSTYDIRTKSDSDEIVNPAAYLSHALLVLSKIRALLDMVGITIYICTACNIILVFSALSKIFYFAQYFYLYSSVGAMFFVFLAVIAFDLTRRRGNAIFEEISDELQWRVTSTYVERDSTETFERPSIEARIRLRDFARASQLMLFPGRNGPALFLAVNVSVTFMLLVFSRLSLI